MTVKELQAVAKENGIGIPAATRRKDIIEMLKKSRGSQISQDKVSQGTSLDYLEGPDPPAGGEAIFGSDVVDATNIV